LRHFLFWTVALTLLGGIAPARWSAADETDDSAPRPATSDSAAPSKVAPPAAAGVQDEPQVIYLPDENGKLQPILNVPLERLQTLLRQEKGAQADAPPSHVVELAVTGQVERQRARLDFTIQVQTTSSDWIKVPLRLDGVVLEPDSIQWEGAAEHLLAPDKGGGGYACWLRRSAEEPVILRFRGLARLESAGDETRLRLQTPLAATQVLELTVPGSDLVARAADEALLEQSIDGENTRFKLSTARGPLELSWWRRGESGRGAAPALEATGSILAQLGHRHVEETALLTVRSLDRPFDRFRVRLPEGATLKSGSGHSYAAIESSTAGEREQGPGGWIYEIQLEQPVRQTEVRLVSERSDLADGAFVQLAGFEVLEARRQSGFLAVVAEGGWQVAFGEHDNMHRTPDAEAPAELRRQPIAASFSYVAQPCSLEARLVRRQARRVVEPTFVFGVEKDRVRLDARLKYNISGARIDHIELRWPDADWQIEEVGPPNLVNVEQLNLSGVLPTIPLAQPTTGELEVTLRATRRLDPAQPRLVLQAPAPVADLVKPAIVVIAPADNLRVVPRVEELLGLTRLSRQIVRGLPTSQQEPLYYRADSQQHRFAAEVEALARAITSQMVVEAVRKADAWQVEARFNERIANVPAAQLSFEIGVAAPQRLGLRVAVDGQALSANDIQWSPTEVAQRWRMSVPLSTERLGECSVVLTYRVADAAGADAAAAMQLPLFRPLEAEVVDARASLTTPEGWEVAAVAPPWRQTAVTASGNGAGGALQLEATGDVPTLKFQVKRTEAARAAPLVVDRQWAQSWFSGAERQDRVVWRLVTTRPQVEFALPAGAVLESRQVFVDGRRSTSLVAGRDRVRVDLQAGAQSAPRVVELIYRFATRRGGWSRLPVEPAALVGADLTRHGYWQMVLPEYRYLALEPHELVTENVWRWRRFFAAREPRLTTSELEQWVGARHEPTAPPAANQYLFSMLGPPTAVSLTVIDRTYLVLLGSGVVLCVGLAFLQLPALRRPAVLLLLAVLLAAAVLWDSSGAMVIAQSASLGVALVVVAGVLKRLVAGRRPAPAAWRRSPSSIIERGSTQHPRAVVAPGSNSSTKAGVSLELAQESKSN